MRGFCGQRKMDAYAWAAADAKPTPMRGPQPTQKKIKKKINQYMRPFCVQCKSCVGFYSFWPTRVASANGHTKIWKLNQVFLVVSSSPKESWTAQYDALSY